MIFRLQDYLLSVFICLMFIHILYTGPENHCFAAISPCAGDGARA